MSTAGSITTRVVVVTGIPAGFGRWATGRCERGSQRKPAGTGCGAGTASGGGGFGGAGRGRGLG
ncbi:hypothetical protein GA0115257_1072101, partial [Streptomyces sp. LcepLS]